MRRELRRRRAGARTCAGLVAVICSLALLSEARTVWAASSPFRISQQPDYVTIYEGELPVLRYVRGEILAPGVPEDRRRSTYVHPVYSLDGKPLTDDFPADHHHHRGMSWMWLKVVSGELSGDLWTLKGVHQRFERLITPAIYDDSVLLRVRNGWYHDASGRKLLDETVSLRVHRADGKLRLIDCELRLSASTDPVTIGVSATGYSGFGIRFAEGADKQIRVPSGLISKDEDRKPHQWADYSSRFSGQPGRDGIAILDNSRNPNSPPGWTLRFYGYINPAFTSAASDYTIEPGSPLTLRYRVVVHRGDLTAAELQRLYDDYNKDH